MKINEIFYSIQGEGKWTGLPNIFIRTTGCNLRCSFCDTKYAYYDGYKMSINKIIKHIQKFPCKYVCITGGEPLEQNETLELIEMLIKKKYMVCLETNGSKNIKDIANKKDLLISMDIKCPSSNMDEEMILGNISNLKKKDQIKFVIKDKDDYDFAKNIVEKYQPICIVFFQPVWGSALDSLAEWIIKDGLNVKFGLQLHKIIWGEKNGV